MAPVVVDPSSTLRYVADLDGRYLWLAASGAATHAAAGWDSLFGLEASYLRVREHAPLGVLGAGLGGARISRGGWRIGLDLAAGTRVADRVTLGLAVGPILEIPADRHALVGASAVAWGFVGITPYVRVGVLSDGTTFVDIGAQLGLPIARF